VSIRGQIVNREHVNIVMEGGNAIREWRISHLHEQLQLSGADLAGASLVGADLSKAAMYDTNLCGSDLAGANLSNAVLFAANLNKSNLKGVNLHQAQLIATSLRGADLSGAALSFAIFANAVLTQTNLSGSHLAYTVFADCDLSQALGLESAVHDGPSTIGLDTIVRSGGNIPRSFLQAAGVPDGIVARIHPLVEALNKFYTCFISYSGEDEAFANQIYSDLKGKGLRCWYYPHSAILGRRTWDDIDQAIGEYDKLIVICSVSSLNSPAVLREIERALVKEDAIARANAQIEMEGTGVAADAEFRDSDVLIPIRIDNYVFQDWQHARKTDLTSRTIGDFIGWDQNNEKYEDSLARLLHALDPVSWPAADPGLEDK